MKRRECESIIAEKLKEIRKVYSEFTGGVTNYLSLTIGTDYISFNNDYFCSDVERIDYHEEV